MTSWKWVNGEPLLEPPREIPSLDLEIPKTDGLPIDILLNEIVYSEKTPGENSSPSRDFGYHLGQIERKGRAAMV